MLFNNSKNKNFLKILQTFCQNVFKIREKYINKFSEF